RRRDLARPLRLRTCGRPGRALAERGRQLAAPGARRRRADRRVRPSAMSELRDLMRRFPRGVAVVAVAVEGQELGLTVSSLVSLSLEPPLVGFAIRRDAALHELLREADAFAASLLSAGQEALAQHFARGVPPIALWEG